MEYTHEASGILIFNCWHIDELTKMEHNLCANALEFHQFFALIYRYVYLLLQCDYYSFQTLCLPGGGGMLKRERKNNR